MIETLQDTIIMPSEIFSLLMIVFILLGIFFGLGTVVLLQYFEKIIKERRKYMKTLNEKQLRQYLDFRSKI